MRRCLSFLLLFVACGEDAFDVTFDLSVPGEHAALGALRSTKSLSSDEAREIRIDAQALLGRDALSADGRYFVFVTDKPLVAIDTNNRFDVYRLDRTTGEFLLVSINRAGTNGGNGNSNTPVISADGMTVAFMSAANDIEDPNTTPDPNGNTTDLFVRHLDDSPRRTMMLTSAGIAIANAGPLDDFVLSRDGEVVAFTSAASNLAGGITDTNGVPDVFVRFTRVITDAGIGAVMASQTPSSTSGNGPSSRPRLSADGLTVVYQSRATDLTVFDDDNDQNDVFIANWSAGGSGRLPVPVSRVPGEQRMGNGAAVNAEVSDSGDVIVFDTTSTNIADERGGVAFSRSTGAYELFTVDASGAPLTDGNGLSEPQVSSDGAIVVFNSNAFNVIPPALSERVRHVYARDLFNGDPQTRRLTRGVGGVPADRDFEELVLARDAKVAAWVSRATNLSISTGTANQVFQIAVGASPQAGAVLASIGRDSASAGEGASARPVISRDGRVLSFFSFAENLDTPILVNLPSAYVRDMSQPACELVSIKRLSRTPTGGGEVQSRQALSADGRFLVFTTSARDLIEGDNNATTDVFRADLVTGEIQLVSRSHFTGQPANGESGRAVISGSGRFVAFQSRANDMMPPGFTDGAGLDVFRWDATTGDMMAISVQAIFPTLTIGGQNPTISADGRAIAFVTTTNASQFGTVSDTNNATDVILARDVGGQLQFSVISVALDAATTGNAASSQPSLSADGTRVAFTSSATNVSDAGDFNAAPDVFVRILDDEGRTVAISQRSIAAQTGNFESSDPAISADGQVVAFVTRATDLIGTFTSGAQIYRRHVGSSTSITLVSRNISGTAGSNGNNSNKAPALSGDGSVATWLSDSTDLTADTRPALAGVQVYLRDIDGQQPTRLLSRSLTDEASLGGAFGSVAITPDGGAIAYTSFAADIVELDNNEIGDVFIQTFNRAPLADDMQFTTTKNTPFAIVFDATDPDGDALTFSGSTTPSLGTVNGSPPNSFVYTPLTNVTGVDFFIVTASDGDDETDFGVTVTINDVPLPNGRPTVRDLNVSVPYNQTLREQMRASDPDGDTLTFTITAAPQKGIVVVDNEFTGEFRYTPTVSRPDVDTFSFSVSDGQDASLGVGTVTILITEPNDPPTITSPTNGAQLTARVGFPLFIPVDAVDPEGDDIAIVISPTPGAKEGGDNVVFVPPLVLAGQQVSLSITAIDTQNNVSETVQVTIAVEADGAPKPGARGCTALPGEPPLLLLALLTLRRRRLPSAALCIPLALSGAACGINAVDFWSVQLVGPLDATTQLAPLCALQTEPLVGLASVQPPQNTFATLTDDGQNDVYTFADLGVANPTPRGEPAPFDVLFAFGGPLSFDMGPNGAIYESTQPVTYAIGTVDVTRTLIGGVMLTNSAIELDTALTQSCAVEGCPCAATETFSWRFEAAGNFD